MRPAGLVVTARAVTAAKAEERACRNTLSHRGSRVRLNCRRIRYLSLKGPPPESEAAAPPIDRTVKLYIGGKQARPDSGYSLEVRSADGKLLGEASLGNRKDIRNAVEAAHKAAGWAKNTAHNRAQVLYYMAENLAQRTEEISHRLAEAVGRSQADREVALSHRENFFVCRMG